MITDFEVTYGEALAPAGFRRCTRPDKEKSANVNTGSGRAGQTYLWIHRGAQRGTPVVAVDVIYNDEPVPRGFERVARDMCKGSGRSSYLCFRRQRVAQAQQLQQDEEEDQGKEEEDERGQALAVDEQPLAEVVLAAGYEDPGPGFVRLDKPLSCKGESPLFLCYKRVLPVGPPDSQPWSPSALRVRIEIRVGCGMDRRVQPCLIKAHHRLNCPRHYE